MTLPYPRRAHQARARNELREQHADDPALDQAELVHARQRAAAAAHARSVLRHLHSMGHFGIGPLPHQRKAPGRSRLSIVSATTPGASASMPRVFMPCVFEEYL